MVTTLVMCETESLSFLLSRFDAADKDQNFDDAIKKVKSEE
jgi:hypothetical protein